MVSREGKLNELGKCNWITGLFRKKIIDIQLLYNVLVSDVQQSDI